jgi:hypothetical protein
MRFVRPAVSHHPDIRGEHDNQHDNQHDKQHNNNYNGTVLDGGELRPGGVFSLFLKF